MYHLAHRQGHNFDGAAGTVASARVLVQIRQAEAVSQPWYPHSILLGPWKSARTSPSLDPALTAHDGRAMKKVEGPEADETQSSRVKAEPLAICRVDSQMLSLPLAI